MFRSIMTRALIAGTVAGIITFAAQYAIVSPLIATAETLEASAVSGHEHDAAAEWEPADGLERTGYMLLGTVLTGIGFAAIAFGVAAVAGIELTLMRGLALGLAGFLCCALAPAFGLPPKPPGVSGPDVYDAQRWWVMTAVSTALAIWLIARGRRSPIRWGCGVAIAAMPHALGAPVASSAPEMPAALMRQFVVVSIATQALLWLTLGAVGGWMAAAAPHRRD